MPTTATCRVEPKDVDRAFQEFPFGPVNNMIVMTDDGWHTVYFGKPYIYSLLAAPFARLFGANGMLFFNMLMTMAMVWMGYLYLRRYNPPGIAALFSASFFLLSVGFSYVFWIQPEVFNMAAVAACLFFGLPRRRRGRTAGPPRASCSSRPSRAPCWCSPSTTSRCSPPWGSLRSGPICGRAGGRALGALDGGRRPEPGIVAADRRQLTGHPVGLPRRPPPGGDALRAGQGADRPATERHRPTIGRRGGGRLQAHGQSRRRGPQLAPPATPGRGSSAISDVTLYEEMENIGYFLVGRHTGMLVYTPFAALAVALLPAHRGHAAVRGALGAAGARSPPWRSSS